MAHEIRSAAVNDASSIAETKQVKRPYRHKKTERGLTLFGFEKATFLPPSR